MDIEYFIHELVDAGIFKIAPSATKSTWFTLKSNEISPIYWDIRNIQWYPELRRGAASLLARTIAAANLEYDFVVPVAMGGLSLGFDTSMVLGTPALTLRDAPKNHGDKQIFIGRPNNNDIALPVEDVFASGISTLNTVQKLRSIGMTVKNAVSFLDREQGAVKLLNEHGIIPVSAIKQSDIIDIVLTGHPMRAVVYDYLRCGRI